MTEAEKNLISKVELATKIVLAEDKKLFEELAKPEKLGEEPIGTAEPLTEEQRKELDGFVMKHQACISCKKNSLTMKGLCYWCFWEKYREVINDYESKKSETENPSQQGNPDGEPEKN